MLDFILAIIWIVLLVTYIVLSWKDLKSNRECKTELLNMNSLLIEQNMAIKEQNAELIKANQNLNRVIVRVCSKSVRDRNEAKKKMERQGIECSKCINCDEKICKYYGCEADKAVTECASDDFKNYEQK